MINGDIDFFDANERLFEIEKDADSFGGPYKEVATGFMMSAACSILFYGGDVMDSFLAGLLGTILVLIEMKSSSIPGATHVLGFVSTLLFPYIFSHLTVYPLSCTF